jgi:hypothetical protein
MTRFFSFCAFAFTACAALTCGSARAATIFSNPPGTDATCDGTSFCGNQGVAGAFTPDANFTLLDVVVPVANVQGTDGAIIELLSDNSDSPGSVIEQWTVTPPAYSFGSIPSSSTVEDVDSVSLVSGDQYWIAVLPKDSSSLDVIFTSSTGESDDYGDGSWQPVSGELAFEVDGTAEAAATPEPGTICLLGIGLVAAAIARRRGCLVTP